MLCIIDGHKNHDQCFWSVQYVQSLFYKNRLLYVTQMLT
jgi:hypothetical protein